MKILLICNAGMSTSLFVQNLNEYMKKEGKDWTFTALPMDAAKISMNDYDFICVAPQIRYMESEVKKLTTKNQPIFLIPPMIYGTMNVEEMKSEIEKVLA